MSSPSVNVQLVQATVSGAVGQAVAAVQRLQGSVSNQDFVVQLADATQLVVKAGPATELAAEAWACRRLTALGVPVPAVIAVNLDGAELGLPFLILSFVTGSPTEDPGVAREAGRWFRRVHAVKLPGWGPVMVGDQVLGPRAHGRHESWSAAILAELAGVVELVDAGILDGTLAKSACSHVAVDELLAYRDPGVLLHNDLKPAHIFGRADGRQVRLSAVIDWGDATVGDPAADLARLSMAGPTITAAFLDGYGAQLTADLQDRLTRYRILWNLRALTYEYRAGGTWFDTYRDRIRNDTSRLSR